MALSGMALEALFLKFNEGKHCELPMDIHRPSGPRHQHDPQGGLGNEPGDLSQGKSKYLPPP